MRRVGHTRTPDRESTLAARGARGRGPGWHRAEPPAPQVLPERRCLHDGHVAEMRRAWWGDERAWMAGAPRTHVSATRREMGRHGVKRRKALDGADEPCGEAQIEPSGWVGSIAGAALHTGSLRPREHGGAIVGSNRARPTCLVAGGVRGGRKPSPTRGGHRSGPV
eukprot:1076194-Prymnesium_polylepis.1